MENDSFHTQKVAMLGDWFDNCLSVKCWCVQKFLKLFGEVECKICEDG